MLGCCGLDCSQCGAYIATQEDDWNKRVEVAKEWSEKYKADFTPEQIVCNGCTSDGPWFTHAEHGCEIRKCCIEKSVPTCLECDEYACEQLQGFFLMVPDAKKNFESLQ